MAGVREIFEEADARQADAEARRRSAFWKHEQIEASADAEFYREVKSALRSGFKSIRALTTQKEPV